MVEQEPLAQPGSPGHELAVRGRYLPGLEGLRGVAVGIVLVFHLVHPRILSGGYLGVDLFFVLSGFLITSLLVEERLATGRLALLAFWIRRAKRLLPALFALLALVTVLVVLHAWLVNPLSDPHLNPSRFRAEALAGIFFYSNWSLLYGMQSFIVPMTAPLWSLAVEEQFYLVWPLVTLAIFALGRRHQRRLGVATSLLLGLASTAATWLVFSATQDDSLVYLSTHMHASGLLGGAALAWFVAGRPQPGPRARRWLAWLGPLAALGIAWLVVVGGSWHSRHFQAIWMNTWGWPLFVLLAVMVVADVRQVQASPLAKLLSWAPLRLLGLISYGLYIVHPVVFNVLTPERLHLGRWPLAAVHLAVSVAVASLSYRYLEQPIRRSKLVDRKPWLVLVAFATITAVVIVGTSPLVTGRVRDVPWTSKPADAIANPPEGSFGSVGKLVVPGASSGYQLVLAGSAMADQLAGALGSALAGSNRELVLESTSGSFAEALDGLRPSDRASLTIASCGVDDLRGPGSASTAEGRRADLAAVAGLLERRPSGGIAIIGCPQLSPERQSRDGAGQAAFNLMAIDAARTHPGRVAYLGTQGTLNLVGRYSRFLPPAAQPDAPFGPVRWEVARMTDGFLLCPAGAVRVVAASLGELRQMGYDLNPTSRWWRGSWTTSPAFTSPGGCTTR